MNISSQVYWTELLLFYAFAFGVIFLPLRWSILCLLLAGNVAVNSPSFVSVSAVSWQNAAEAIVLPTLLMLRLTRFRLPSIRWTLASKLWTALIIYASVSTLWSPFKLSGFKMTAYLAAWLILYLVFDLAWGLGLVDQGLILAALWGSLGLACLQTYVLGNPLFGMTGLQGRFVSAQFAPFRGPQFFGPFLTCLLALLIFSKERHAGRSFSIGACLVALVLVGSRYSLIAAGIVVFGWCLLWAKALRRTGRIRFTPVFGSLLFCAIAFLGLRTIMAWAMPGSRVNQLLELGAKPQLLEEGDFGWRLVLYQRTLALLSQRSPTALIFGTGTSSGGAIVAAILHHEPEDLDPNRTIHDEFLRAQYEWGFIGLGLGLTLLAFAVRQLWARFFHMRSLAAFAALTVVPGMLLALLVENPLAGAGSAESLGYLLVLTYGFGAAGRVRAYVRTRGGPLLDRAPNSGRLLHPCQ